MSANIQLSHAEGSFFLDEYYRDARSCFSILDMRGQTEWFDKSHSEVVEIFNILDGSIAPGNCLLRKIELTYVDRSALEYLAQTAPFNGEKVHEDGWIVPDYLDDEEDEDEDEDEDSASQASEGSCEPRAPTVIQCVLFVYSNYEFVLRNATNGRIRLVKKAMAPLRDYMRKQGQLGLMMYFSMLLSAHVCVRACVRACVRVCVRACMRACACVCVRAHTWVGLYVHACVCV